MPRGRPTSMPPRCWRRRGGWRAMPATRRCMIMTGWSESYRIEPRRKAGAAWMIICRSGRGAGPYPRAPDPSGGPVAAAWQPDACAIWRDYPDPAIRALFAAIDAPIRRHIAAIGEGGQNYALAGAWSVRLNSGGFHINHIHPEGWLSSAFYVRLPDRMQGQEGWLKFGEPGPPTAPPLRCRSPGQARAGPAGAVPQLYVARHGALCVGRQAPVLRLRYRAALTVS